MLSSESQSRLEQIISAAGKSVASLSAAEAIRFMLDFYCEVRSDDCALDDDGDQLLFQWGVYDWEGQESFHYDITRQFIAPGTEDEDGMSQLSLTFHFAVSDALRDLDEGHEWCPTPARIAEFESFIKQHPATSAVATLQPLQITLNWEPI